MSCRGGTDPRGTEIVLSSMYRACISASSKTEYYVNHLISSLWQELWCVLCQKVWGGGEWLLHPLPSSFLFDYHTPLVKISFSPQTSTTVKIKDGTCNFHQESAEHLLTLKLCLPCRLLKYLLYILEQILNIEGCYWVCESYLIINSSCWSCSRSVCLFTDL